MCVCAYKNNQQIESSHQFSMSSSRGYMGGIGVMKGKEVTI